MLPYPPTVKRDASERSLLRVLGGILASLSILLALLSIIFHQRVSDLVLAIIVGMFALRVLLLWQGNTSQRQQLFPARPSTERYAVQAPASPQGRPALYASSSSQSRPLRQLAAEQHVQQSMSLPPKLPRSVRPQRQPGAPAFPSQSAAPPQQGVQPLPPSQPPSLWRPPAPVPQHSERGNWQYDDGNM